MSYGSDSFGLIHTHWFSFLIFFFDILNLLKRLLGLKLLELVEPINLCPFPPFFVSTNFLFLGLFLLRFDLSFGLGIV